MLSGTRSNGSRQDPFAPGAFNRLGGARGSGRFVALEPALELVIVGADELRTGRSATTGRFSAVAQTLDLCLLGKVVETLLFATADAHRQVVGVRSVGHGRRPQPPVELNHLVGDAVDEAAVVGNHEHGDFGLLEVILEPDESRQIEVVGRLVEKQNVVLPKQHGDHGDLALLAAGEL